MTPVSSAKREWLARRPAGNEFNLILEDRKVYVADVALMGLGPFGYRLNVVRAVFAYRVAAPTIAFDDERWTKTSPANSQP
jgi:hypothetical protein